VRLKVAAGIAGDTIHRIVCDPVDEEEDGSTAVHRAGTAALKRIEGEK